MMDGTAVRPPKAPFWARVWWLLERAVNRWRLPGEVKRMKWELARASARPRLQGVVVSLTTHGERVNMAHLAVESILRGTVTPERVILWVDEPKVAERPPLRLQRLVESGQLEIRLSGNYGPHTKYYPTVQHLGRESSFSMVTADDDIVYPAYWLRRLTAASRRQPGAIYAYRCHKIRFDSSSRFAAYSRWAPAFARRSPGRLFFTGVSGVLYPSTMIAALNDGADEFASRAPRADDVWLNFVALREGVPIRQIGIIPRHFPIVPGTQLHTLVSSNVQGSANDRQLADTFSRGAVRALYDRATSIQEGDIAAANRKVIFVDHSALPSGGQLGLVRYLQAAPIGHTGVVLGGGEAFDSLPKERVSKLGSSHSAWGFLRARNRLKAHLRDEAPDVIVANSTKAAFVIASLPLPGTAVRIFYARSDIDRSRMSAIKYFLITWTLARFDAFLANSSWTETTLPSRLISKPRRIAYPISGIPARSSETLAMPAFSGSARAHEPLRLLSLSRVARWKGIDVLLEALSKLERDGKGPLFELTIAGASHHEDAAYAEAIKQRVNRDFPNVHIVGHSSDVDGLLKRHDVLILASVQPEPFGQVVVQAMAQGLVVVASSHGGPVELIEDGMSGLLVAPGDAEALAKLLLEIAEDPSGALRIASHARVQSRRYSDTVTINKLRSSIDELYELVTAREHASSAQGLDTGKKDGVE